MLGLELIERPGRLCFALPCPRLRDRTCTVYEQRPSPCREYECSVLERLRAREISMDEAERRVGAAVNLFADIQRETEGTMTLPELRYAVRTDVVLPERLKLLVLAFTVFVDRHFRGRAEGHMVASSALSPDSEGDTE